MFQKNLCAKIPDSVDDDSAAFVVLASIALQGIRLAKPTIGEYFVVTGAGLVGLLAIQILLAQGCKVLAIDFDKSKLDLAKKFGADVCNPSEGEDPVELGMSFSKGRGVDGVIITAATPSNDPISQAAQMSRKRGRIILVGVIGLQLDRADFYEKELTFQVSCSYGPGRYDPEYEDNGNDYPIGFVRWTEQRNFEAVLDMLSKGLINTKILITHKIKFDEAPKMYKDLGKEYALGTIIEYSSAYKNRLDKKIILNISDNKKITSPVIGFIGAGGYASRVLIPALRKTNVYLHTLISSGGVNASLMGRKFSFDEVSSDYSEVFNTSSINTVFIATRHNTHSKFVIESIKNNKNVFVEKPLAISQEELDSIKNAIDSRTHKNLFHIMVGFNRRFSPHIKKIKSLLSTIVEPKTFIMTMNVGFKESSDWTQDKEIGGGRIIGEACHYIDLMRFLADSPIISISARCMGDNSSSSITEDKAAITLAFENGSFGTIFYLANGSNSFPKERIEVFAAGKILQLDNFRKLHGFGWKNFKKMNLMKQNKGNVECVEEFITGLQTGKPAIPVEEVIEVSQATIDVAEILRNQN